MTAPIVVTTTVAETNDTVTLRAVPHHTGEQVHALTYALGTLADARAFAFRVDEAAVDTVPGFVVSLRELVEDWGATVDRGSELTFIAELLYHAHARA